MNEVLSEMGHPPCISVPIIARTECHFTQAFEQINELKIEEKAFEYIDFLRSDL